jgi:hypothetical protein
MPLVRLLRQVGRVGRVIRAGCGVGHGFAPLRSRGHRRPGPRHGFPDPGGLAGLIAVARDADPASKAEIYARLGLILTYRHRTVHAEGRS